MASFDVTVRGAGIFGLSVAWACLERGACVQVIDPSGVGAGASGGIVGALAPHTPENWNPKKAFQFESLLMARALWPRIEAITGMATGYCPSGRLQPIPDARALERAQARAQTAQALWQGKAAWRIIEGGAGWQPQSPTGQLIEDTLSAHLHPKHATQALARAIEMRGGTLSREAEDGGAVVWATGAAGLAQLSEALGAQVGAGQKGQAALFDLDRAGQPQLFADALHIVPHHDGTVAVGSTSEAAFDPALADQTDAALDGIIARARAALPELSDAPVIARWAGLRPRARSRAPMLGPWPGRPGHFIANGGFKIGFGMAPKVGMVMADLLLEGKDTIPKGFRVEDSLS
ncbi:MAG: FAD-binding oxidoreductase [Pseudomonadota bacterium]